MPEHERFGEVGDGEGVNAALHQRAGHLRKPVAVGVGFHHGHQFGVPDALQDPTLELHDGTGALIGTNDNWQTTIIGGIITHDQVQEIQDSGYAPGDGRESAIIADLPAGNYTAIVRGVNSTTGVALVEVYDLH